MPDWGQTLLEFLRHSNEDDAYTRWFKLLTPRLTRGELVRTASIKWLDIGSGPGTKTGRLLRLLNSLSNAVHIDVVEPDPAWATYLAKELRDAALGGVTSSFYRSTLQVYGEAQRPNILDAAGGLVTAFQVLYDGALVEQIAQLIHQRRNSLFIISAESFDSDLSRLRREVSCSTNLMCTRSYLPDLVARTETKTRHIKTVNILGKRMSITSESIGELDSPGWFMPFVLGTDFSAYMSLSRTAREKLLGKIRDWLRLNGPGDCCELRIPDIALIVLPEM